MGGLQVWDEAVTRKLADPLPENSSPVLGTGFDRAGTTLWTCQENGRVEAWSLPACQSSAGRAWTIPTTGKVSAATFDPTTDYLAVGDRDGRVLLARTDGEGQRFLLGATTDITALAWSPDGRSVAAGCHTGDIHLWDVASGRPLLIPAFGGEIRTLLFHPCGQWLVAADSVRTCRVLDVVTGQIVLECPYCISAFSHSGQRFAAVNGYGVRFASLHSPTGLRRFFGHQLCVDRLAWSRDNRHLASLDGHFEIRVWDLTGEEPVATFQQRSTDFYASNAAIALSDDARLLAYASGGESSAKVLIREVATGAIRSSWTLGGGFECLACTGGDNFLLVREELDVSKMKTRTVAHELSPGRALSKPREIRPAEPGDVRRFFDHGLSADGRYHWWTGPRLTPRNRRVEVHDIKAGIRLPHLLQPTDDETEELTANLSPDGRHLWYRDSLGVSRWEYDLDRPKSPTPVTLMPLALSPDKQWSVTTHSHQEPFLNDGLFLGRGWIGEMPWLAFGGQDGSTIVGETACFSPNGRYLAWGDDRGTVLIADLRLLEEQVQAFAEDVLPD
jgi:WD40 repeat protein